MTEPTLVHLDVESTALHARRRAWEVAAIVDRPGEEPTEHHWFVDIFDLDLADADVVSLNIGRFWDRHPQAAWVKVNDIGQAYIRPDAMTRPPIDRTVREHELVPALAELFHDRAIICGSNPAFDQYTLEPRMLAHNTPPAWHYHPEDVPGLARGWLAAQGLPAPRKSDEIARACGLDPDWYERHTALGDCRLFRDLHRIVTQPPKRPPAGGWPIGGRPARRWRTCASCGDDIWPNELVYPADASGDTSEAAGVQCAVCEAQSLAAEPVR